jgi:hypothetical protein
MFLVRPIHLKGRKMVSFLAFQEFLSLQMLVGLLAGALFAIIVRRERGVGFILMVVVAGALGILAVRGGLDEVLGQLTEVIALIRRYPDITFGIATGVSSYALYCFYQLERLRERRAGFAEGYSAGLRAARGTHQPLLMSE